MRSVSGQLETSIESVNNLDMEILTNERDLMLVFHDSQGDEIHNGLDVRIRNRKLPFHKKSHVFVLGRSNRQGMVQVHYNNHTSASYVMIQVPVPAGCSYPAKENSYSQGEVYCENYSHQTNIYCENLRTGKYTYQIKLVPRFKGSYHLNPATVEWIYFPTVFGREEMKLISIAEQGK